MRGGEQCPDENERGRDVSGRGVVRHESLSDKVIFEQRRQGCDWVSSVNIQPGRR